MNHAKLERPLLAFKTARKDWVVAEFQKLLDEWRAWQKHVETIVDHPYDRNTQSSVYADGEPNMDRHSILLAKTLTFLDNNLVGHWFIVGRDGDRIDATDLRLKFRVRHQILQLQEMEASLTYATVPDSFWKEKAKALVDSVVRDPYKAAEMVEKALRDPFG